MAICFHEYLPRNSTGGMIYRAFGAVAAIAAAVSVAIFQTLELPKTPPVPVVSHITVVPSYRAHDGPLAPNPLRYCVAQPRGPPVSADELFSLA